MASDINRVVLVGRLTRDPEVRYTPNGSAVANFAIAINRKYVSGGEKKEEVSFINIVAWGKLAELCKEFIKKGRQIAVDGRLQQRKWQTQEGQTRSTVEVIAENIEFLSEPRGGSTPMEDNYPEENKAAPPFDDEDIPF